MVQEKIWIKQDKEELTDEQANALIPSIRVRRCQRVVGQRVKSKVCFGGESRKNSGMSQRD